VIEMVKRKKTLIARYVKVLDRVFGGNKNFKKFVKDVEKEGMKPKKK
jgi:hypothetical protein